MESFTKITGKVTSKTKQRPLSYFNDALNISSLKLLLAQCIAKSKSAAVGENRKKCAPSVMNQYKTLKVKGFCVA